MNKRFFQLKSLILCFFIIILQSCLTNSLDKKLSSSYDKIENDSKLLPYETSEECKKFISELPKSYAYDFIEVPENWKNPNSQKINIFYYWNKIIQTNPKITPVVFYNGGPAYSSHSSFTKFQKDPALNSFPFIFIDQRGNGCSTNYPKEKGRIFFYGSDAIVNDSEAIRIKFLGQNSKWHIFGHSYGGLVVRRYLEIASLNLLKVVSYGYSSFRSPEKKVARMISQKRALDDYLKTYPDQINYLKKLRQKLDEKNPCFQDQISKICGSVILDGIAVHLSFRDYFPKLRESLLSLLNVDDSINLSNLNIFYKEVNGENDDTQIAMTIISILEHTADPYDPTDLWGAQRATQILKGKGIDSSLWLLNEARWSLAENDIEKNASKEFYLHNPIKYSVIDKNLKNNKSIQFIILAGGLDSTNPPETFQIELGKLNNLVKFKIFQKFGHEGSYKSEVLKEYFQEYIP